MATAAGGLVARVDDENNGDEECSSMRSLFSLDNPINYRFIM
jgi:hypothetical protein